MYRLGDEPPHLRIGCIAVIFVIRKYVCDTIEGVFDFGKREVRIARRTVSSL
jgi:hypothetical protein